jgi:hypothetical protein
MAEDHAHSAKGLSVTHYIIYFNQQWVGDHTEEWFAERGPLANAVVDEMKAAGVLVFAGGLEEEPEKAIRAEAIDDEVSITQGPFTDVSEFLGGLTIIDVPDEDTATMWAGKIAVACGWRQELRPIK